MIKKCITFFIVCLTVVSIKGETAGTRRIWNFTVSGRKQSITIMISDTLIRDIPAFHYREIHSINPLLNVDLCLNRNTRAPLSYFITAVGENVEICDTARYYMISKTFDGKDQFFKINYDTLAFPFYGRFAIPILKEINGNHVEKLYLAKGITVLYNFESLDEEILSLNGEEILCEIWKLSALSKDFPFQPVDLLWIRKDPPYDLLQIKMNVSGGRFLGFKVGNRNALYKRVL